MRVLSTRHDIRIMFSGIIAILAFIYLSPRRRVAYVKLKLVYSIDATSGNWSPIGMCFISLQRWIFNFHLHWSEGHFYRTQSSWDIVDWKYPSFLPGPLCVWAIEVIRVLNSSYPLFRCMCSIFESTFRVLLFFCVNISCIRFENPSKTQIYVEADTRT